MMKTVNKFVRRKITAINRNINMPIRALATGRGKSNNFDLDVN